MVLPEGRRETTFPQAGLFLCRGTGRNAREELKS